MAKAQKKNGMKPPGKDQDVKQWMQSYIGSPKYQERLANFYKYPDYIQRQRAAVLGGTKITNIPKGTTKYYSYGNEVTINPEDLRKEGISKEEALVHELSHATNINLENKAARLSLPESQYILERTRGLMPEQKSFIIGRAKESGKPLSKVMSERMHDVMPSETKSDVDALRFLLNQRNIYDARTQNINKEILEKAKKDPVIRKTYIFKRLQEAFEDKDLIDIMNKIAAIRPRQQSTLV